ncbi:hypothetical protein G9C98_006830 [Cotesia typhae]|uniref:Protein sleepless n=1 Tax=Cotesia typhae TaxID=2053667 RepID=A0A8J5R223_9HYME|nr:hypothetical protein G9C98_006830 [Cotesia typhae]
MKFYERRQLWIILIIALSSSPSEGSEEGISCYKCTVAPLRGSPEASSQICSQFKENRHFQVYCPKSTMCMKRTIYHRLVNGSIINTSVERDCASQLDIFQAYDYNDRQWKQQEEIVQTAYPEDCFMGEDRGSPGGPPEYCFCRYNLCNNSKSYRGTFTLVVIFLFLMILH